MTKDKSRCSEVSGVTKGPFWEEALQGTCSGKRADRWQERKEVE